MPNPNFRRPPNMQQRPRTAVQDALSKYFAQDFFTYVIPFTETIAAGGTTEGNVTLDADSDFLWQKFTFLALDDADAALEQNLTRCGIIITDSGSGRNLSNSTVPLAALAGSGELPFIMPTPKIFKASGQILVTVNNFGAAAINELYLVFIGQKCYLKAGM